MSLLLLLVLFACWAPKEEPQQPEQALAYLFVCIKWPGHGLISRPLGPGIAAGTNVNKSPGDVASGKLAKDESVGIPLFPVVLVDFLV